MATAVGIVTLIVGLVAWLGQGLAFLAPAIATKLGVLEPREELDPTLYSRVYLRREGKKVGRPASERTAYVFGGIWIASSLAMTALAVSALTG